MDNLLVVSDWFNTKDKLLGLYLESAECAGIGAEDNDGRGVAVTPPFLPAAPPQSGVHKPATNRLKIPRLMTSPPGAK
jgi:hypothetical protein